MRARYYNPEIKRFINQDVVIGSIADSPSLNRYAYVQGNPISLADPFGLSPGVDWRGATHFLLGALSMLTLIPTPITYIIGAAASIANAALYVEEGNYFAAICNAIPVFGGGFSLLGKAGNASCWLMKTLQYSTAGLSIGTGAYDIYQIGKENYQKYVVRGEDFSVGDMFSDLFRGGLDVAGIAGGVKLAQADIPYFFVAGTLIATANGYKPIEEIEVGDKVLSENPETGEIAYKTVEETYINETDELIHVHVNGETISATPNHPFYVDKLGWTLAKNLRAGDILVLSNGELVVVEWIQHEILESPIKVYNFEVEDFHTYFVGQNSVLVHNSCPENNTLLEGEGDFGTYDDLLKQGSKDDNITPHHAPSAEYMKRQGVSRGKSAAFNMEQPQTGGRHRKTLTYGRNMTDVEKANYYSLSPRDALAHDLWDLRRIYMEEGLYDQARPKIIEYSKYVQELFPELFAKK